MNLYKREMQQSIKSLLLWSLGIALLLTAGFGKYAALSSSVEAVKELIELYPASLRALFGIGTFNLGELLGYYGVIYTFVLIIAGIHAAMLGSNIIAKEERDHTSEFLLVKPIMRSAILQYKLLAGLTQMIIFNLLTLAISIGVLSPYKEFGFFAAALGQLMIGLFLFQCLFFAIGQAIAAATKKPERAASLAASILLFTFIITMVSGINANLGFIDYISPFSLFSAKHVVVEKAFPVTGAIIALAIAALCLYAAFRRYPKRDIAI